MSIVADSFDAMINRSGEDMGKLHTSDMSNLHTSR